MADLHAREARGILELQAGASDLDATLDALLAADPALTKRVLACVALPGLGRRGGIEAADLLPLCGLRFVQQVVAGLLLEDAGVDATNTAILGSIAAQAVAARVPLTKNEDVFLSAWLGATPAWRQAPVSWGPTPELALALDKHKNLPADAQINGSRADLIAQCVRLGELLAELASPYAETAPAEAVLRAARLGIAPRELALIAADVARHAAGWSTFLGRPVKAEIRIDVNAAGAAGAARFAVELSDVYRYLLQNAAIDAPTGLPNARYFRTRLESVGAAARRRGSVLSVIAVNCRSEMVTAAQLLRETARMQDVVCRSGEYELVMICIDTHEEYVTRAAERLSAAMGERGIDASFGAAALDSMISSVDDLIARARGAAAQAQAGGVGYRVWTEG